MREVRFLRRLWAVYGAFPVVDHLAHRLHIGGRIRNYLCDKADAAFGFETD